MALVPVAGTLCRRSNLPGDLPKQDEANPRQFPIVSAGAAELFAQPSRAAHTPLATQAAPVSPAEGAAAACSKDKKHKSKNTDLQYN